MRKQPLLFTDHAYTTGLFHEHHTDMNFKWILMLNSYTNERPLLETIACLY